ncbi:MAG: hypothetical protein ABL883_01275 [Terricaulis sp.]
MRALFVAFLFAFYPSSAMAQGNSVVEHFRAYSAALDRGDLATAEAEAETALALSETRDGDGGHTAVLALNLATTRLMKNEFADAREPAQRALVLARRGAVGVNPFFADVVLNRAQLRTGDADAATRLAGLLANEASAQLGPQEIFVAASELGNWALANNNFALATSAWERAVANSAGSPMGQAFGLGRAKTALALAIIREELGPRGRRGIAEDEANEAHRLLGEAVQILWPLAETERPDLELTVAQQAYAEARVLLMGLRAKMHADRRPLLDLPEEAQGDADGLQEIGVVDPTRPRCLMRVVVEPRPIYPLQQARSGEVAGVMVYLRTDETGAVASHQIAARAGGEEFAEAAAIVADRWRTERLEGSAPNCRMEAGLLYGLMFRFAD